MNAIIQHSVLIVSGTQKGAAYITELLSPRDTAFLFDKFFEMMGK